MTSVIDDLEARGLIQDTTDREALATRLAEGPMTLYYGCDPTADSLHIGNMIGLLILRRLAAAGHRPLALVGGSTGMVGDPSGRSDERNLLDADTLADNVARIREQVAAISGATTVNNADWTAEVRLLDFLRDVGKHVTVNQMTAKESVKARLASDQGISFTEFSYMLLQSFDYWWLHDNEGCELQIGGSDQWGNIVGGVDLVRRRSGKSVHALTWPLITRADGTKFGKSMGDNIWLAADRTSPYRLYQYFVNTDDRDVERFLLQLTLLEVDAVAAAMAVHHRNPGDRHAQRLLATEVTTLVHGAEATVAAQEASVILFGGDPTTASAAALEVVAGEVPCTGVPGGRLPPEGLELADVLTHVGLATSKRQARQLADQGAVSVTGSRREATDTVGPSDLLHGRFILVRKGKRHYALLDLKITSAEG